MRYLGIVALCCSFMMMGCAATKQVTMSLNQSDIIAEENLGKRQQVMRGVIIDTNLARLDLHFNQGQVFVITKSGKTIHHNSQDNQIAMAPLFGGDQPVFYEVHKDNNIRQLVSFNNNAERAWELNLTDKYFYFYDKTTRTVVLNYLNQDHVKLSGLDVKTGKITWTKDYPMKNIDDDTLFLADNRAFYFNSNRIYTIDTITGKDLGTIVIANSKIVRNENINKIFHNNNKLFISTKDGMLLIPEEKMTTELKMSQFDQVLHLESDDKAFYILVNQGLIPTLMAYDFKRGKLMWERRKGEIEHPQYWQTFALIKNKLFWGYYNHLVSFNTANGSETIMDKYTDYRYANTVPINYKGNLLINSIRSSILYNTETNGVIWKAGDFYPITDRIAKGAAIGAAMQQAATVLDYESQYINYEYKNATDKSAADSRFYYGGGASRWSSGMHAVSKVLYAMTNHLFGYQNNSTNTSYLSYNDAKKHSVFSSSTKSLLALVNLDTGKIDYKEPADKSWVCLTFMVADIPNNRIIQYYTDQSQYGTLLNLCSKNTYYTTLKIWPDKD
ncbi:MAG: hypothetical protein AB7E76_07985 [Deferribacterales bacterium]